MFFFHICSYSSCCVLRVQLLKQLFLYIHNEVSGAFRSIADFFEIIFFVTWFCLTEAITFWYLLHYKLVKMFQYLRTDRQSLPENVFSLPSVLVTNCPKATRRSLFVNLYVFPMFQWSSTLKLFSQISQYFNVNLCQALFLTKLQNFSLHVY